MTIPRKRPARYWPSVPPNEQAEARALAVAAFREAGTLRAAADLLKSRGAEFCSFGLVKVSVKRAIRAEAEAQGAEGAAATEVGAEPSLLGGKDGSGAAESAKPSEQPTTAAIESDLEAFKRTILEMIDDRMKAKTTAPLPAATQPVASSPAPSPTIEVLSGEFQDPDAVLAALRKTPMTLAEVAAKGKVSESEALAWVGRQKSIGVNLRETAGQWLIEKQAPLGNRDGTLFEYRSRPDNTYLFGAMGDTHLCSRFERLDVLYKLYDRYEQEQVDRVFHAGNWVDGEAHFNKHALKVHGMDNQLEYLVEHYPIKAGIHTYAVTGDDHEGWWTAREGIDPGVRAEQTMRRAGRTDWHNLGYMEANVNLVNANTGKTAVLACVHPGGGSAYALSYSIQKIVESYDGGEKPSVGLYGHYHKMWSGNIRNVWCVQTGCTMDQGNFMRKKRLEAHVGGCLVKLTQDPETGAITEMTTTILRYFNKGYYNNRWNPIGDPNLPERG